MCKALCIALLLVLTLTLVGGRLAASSQSGFIPPQIVARGKLDNQTVPIPTTTIFTVSQAGLYRTSVYATITTAANPSSESAWCYEFFWTDASAKLQAVGQCAADAFLGQWQQSSTPSVQTFQAAAGTSITYLVDQVGGPPDGSVYSLYYTLERLE